MSSEIVQKELPVDSSDFVLLPFKTNCYIDLETSRIHKVRGFTDVREAVFNYYDQLASTGLEVGERPTYYYAPAHGFVEEVPFHPGFDGQTFLMNAESQDAMQFFDTTVLNAMFTVISSQGNIDNLRFSLDPIPHNFVNGAYIDYWEPHTVEYKPDSRLLNVPRLLNYTLARMGRSRPDLFGEFCNLAIMKFHASPVADAANYVRGMRYKAVSEATTPSDVASNLTLVDDIDELLGLSVVLVNKCNEHVLSSIQERLAIYPNPSQQNVLAEQERRLQEKGLQIKWTYDMSTLGTRRRFVIEELFFRAGIKMGNDKYREELGIVTEELFRG